MQFGVFDLINIEKGIRGRAKNPNYVAVFEVTTRTGTKYPKYFTAKNAHKITSWLASLPKYHATARQLDLGARVVTHTIEVPGVRLGGHSPNTSAEERKKPPTTPVVQTATRFLTREEIVTDEPKLVIKQPPAAPPSVAIAEIEGAMRGEAPPPKATATVRQVEEFKAPHQSDVRYKFTRLTDHLRQIDPEGYAQAKQLYKWGSELKRLREQQQAGGKLLSKLHARGSGSAEGEASANLEVADQIRALESKRSQLIPEFNKRKLAMKLSKVVNIREKEKELRAQAEAWFADPTPRGKGNRKYKGKYKGKTNAEVWALYLRRHEAKAKKLAARGLKSKPALQYPSHIQEQLNELKWRKRFLSGDAHYIETKAPKIGVGAHLVIKPSPEGEEGIRPEHGVVSYLLTEGEWSTKDAQGRNLFSIGTSAALYKEFAGHIRTIARGRGFKPGWGKVFDVKDLAQELESHLKVALLSKIAPEYTAAVAERNRERGKNFRSYAVSRLESEAQHFVRDTLADATRRGKADKEDLNEPSLYWSPEGEVTRDILHQAGAPLATPYVSPDDIIAVKQLKTLIENKVGKMEALGLFSRLNLLNPIDEDRLKSWDEVAVDVVNELKKRNQEGPSVAFVRDHLRRTMPRLLGFAKPKEKMPAHAQQFRGWTHPLKPSEREALRDGLQAVVRIAGVRRQSMPGASSWRVLKPVTPKGHGRPAKPGVSVAVPFLSDVHVKKSESGVDVQLEALFFVVRRLLKVA